MHDKQWDHRGMMQQEQPSSAHDRSRPGRPVRTRERPSKRPTQNGWRVAPGEQAASAHANYSALVTLPRPGRFLAILGGCPGVASPPPRLGWQAGSPQPCADALSPSKWRLSRTNRHKAGAWQRPRPVPVPVPLCVLPPASRVTRGLARRASAQARSGVGKYPPGARQRL